MQIPLIAQFDISCPVLAAADYLQYPQCRHDGSRGKELQVNANPQQQVPKDLMVVVKMYLRLLRKRTNKTQLGHLIESNPETDLILYNISVINHNKKKRSESLIHHSPSLPIFWTSYSCQTSCPHQVWVDRSDLSWWFCKHRQLSPDQAERLYHRYVYLSNCWNAKPISRQQLLQKE